MSYNKLLAPVQKTTSKTGRNCRRTLSDTSDCALNTFYFAFKFNQRDQNLRAAISPGSGRGMREEWQVVEGAGSSICYEKKFVLPCLVLEQRQQGRSQRSN